MLFTAQNTMLAFVMNSVLASVVILVRHLGNLLRLVLVCCIASVLTYFNVCRVLKQPYILN